MHPSVASSCLFGWSSICVSCHPCLMSASACQFVCLSVPPSTFLPASPSVCLLVCLSVTHFICLPVLLPVCLSVPPFLFLFANLSLCLPDVLSVCPPVYPSVCLTVCAYCTPPPPSGCCLSLLALSDLSQLSVFASPV